MLDFIVCGSGFKAAYTALKLREMYNKAKISIKSKFFGGLYSSIEKNGFYLDLGCHLYDSNNVKFNKTFDIDLKEIIPVDTNYGSINNFGLTEDYVIYDFRNHHNYEKLKKSFLNNEFNSKRPKNLYDFYKSRFGNEVTSVIDQFCKKITGKSSSEIDSRSHGPFFFRRILMFNNDKSLELKANGYDDLIAAQSYSVHDYSKGAITYTFKNGNKGFLDHIYNILECKKINIIKESRPSKNIIEINSAEEKFQKINTPLHLVYFTCDQFPFTYLHDYSDNPVFRISSPGHYSNQIIDGLSYICLEIPDPKNQYSKLEIINLSKEYVVKFVDAKFLHYQFFHTSYPVFEVSDKVISKNEIDIFSYSKNDIMINIDQYLEKFNLN